MSEELVLLFQDIGLSEAKSKETAKNVNLSKNLEALIKHSKSSSPDLKPVGLLLYHIASKIKPQIHHHRNLLSDYVLSRKIDSEVRVNAALDYLMQKPDPKVNVAALEEACGVGVVVTPEMVEAEVEKAIKAVKAELLEKRYRYNTGLLMAEVRKGLKWADGKAVKSEIDVQVLDLLGTKNEADLAPPPKVDKKAASNQ